MFSPRLVSAYAATIDELRSLGFVEGQNLVVDERGFGLEPEELSSAATLLARSKVDVILAAGALAIGAAQAATQTHHTPHKAANPATRHPNSPCNHCSTSRVVSSSSLSRRTAALHCE